MHFHLRRLRPWRRLRQLLADSVGVIDGLGNLIVAITAIVTVMWPVYQRLTQLIARLLVRL